MGQSEVHFPVYQVVTTLTVLKVQALGIPGIWQTCEQGCFFPLSAFHALLSPVYISSFFFAFFSLSVQTLSIHSLKVHTPVVSRTFIEECNHSHSNFEALIFPTKPIPSCCHLPIPTAHSFIL